MTLYEILGLGPDATPDDIKRAYRVLAKLAHPDTGGSADTMAAINQAYETLSDPYRRKVYDDTGAIAGADNEAATVAQMAFKAVESAIASAPDLKTVDVLAIAVNALEADVTRIKQQQENFVAQAVRYESAIDRIKIIEGEGSALQDMLRVQAAQLHRRVGEGEPIIGRLNRAIAEIKKYRYEHEPPQQNVWMRQMQTPAPGGFIGSIW